MLWQIVATVATGLCGFGWPRNQPCLFENRCVRRATNLLSHIQETDHFFVDESGETWELLSESEGFCNQIYTSILKRDSKAQKTPNKKILKVYSELALRRMQLSGKQSFDYIMGDLGIGPAIFNATEKYVIMEALKGQVLSNQDLLISSSRHLRNIAMTLAKLHCVPMMDVNRGKTNMLWRCCDVLLEKLKGSDKELYHSYTVQLKHQQRVLEALHLSLVLGHGDFKPSNVIVLNDSGEVKLIDWETCGCHYRAYDLAKFFRAVEAHTNKENQLLARNRFIFVQYYCDGSDAALEADADTVLLESRLLLPMTWLEAALFFHCKRYDGSSDANIYSHYAEQRLRAYHDSLEQWELDLKAYQSTRISNTKIQRHQGKGDITQKIHK